MRPADVVIWQRFLMKYPDRFLRVWYDVHVGREEEMPDGVHPLAHASWCDLTSWKIDVVAEDKQFFYVIEVKPFANAKALGQAQSYAGLFVAKFRPDKPVIPVVLTDRIIPTAQECADYCGVKMWEV